MVSFSLEYKDNRLIKGKESTYKTVDVQIKHIIESWKISLFSFEWLTPEGKIRSFDELPEGEQEKYQAVMDDIQNNHTLERPILGIGIMDNIEIGSRRDVLLTVASQEQKSISVHIPVRHEEEFMPYL